MPSRRRSCRRSLSTAAPADPLSQITRIEDTTVATIIRQALADYADDYLLGYLDTLDGPVTDDFGPWLD